MIIIPWLIFAGVIAGIVILNFIITRYLSDKAGEKRFRQEAADRFLPTLVVSFALTISMLCLLLVPIDIYSVSNKANLTAEGLDQFQDAILLMYYILYGMIFAFIFALIPFSYFYYEAGDLETVPSIKKRLFTSALKTIMFVAFVLLIFVVGLFVKEGSPQVGDDYSEYVHSVVYSKNAADQAMILAIAIVSMISFVFFIFYAGYGLAAFPLSWIKGSRSYTNERQELDSNLRATKAEKRSLNEKYLSGSKKVSKSDERRLRDLESRELTLTDVDNRLVNTRTGIINNCWRATRPFYIVFGVLFSIISLFIIVSFILTQLDRLINSPCGLKCGYLLDKPHRWNPIDTGLVLVSRIFPIDYVAIGSIIFYIFFATLGGLMAIGVSVPLYRLAPVQPNATSTQGLLLGTVILMFSLLALNMELMSLAPQYINFGSQTYIEKGTSDEIRCDWSADPTLGQCHMTQIGKIFSRISLGLPFFGVVYYYATWAFIAVYFLGFVVALFRKRRSNISEAAQNELDWGW